MSKTTCTISVDFTGAHRLTGIDIPCQALHGHFYRASFTFEAAKLRQGMVVEFDAAKDKIQRWFKQNWDHNIILHKSDRKLGGKIAKITKQKIFYVDFNPTAENLGEYLINKVCPQLFKGSGAKCVKIHMQETPDYAATITL